MRAFKYVGDAGGYLINLIAKLVDRDENLTCQVTLLTCCNAFHTVRKTNTIWAFGKHKISEIQKGVVAVARVRDSGSLRQFSASENTDK